MVNKPLSYHSFSHRDDSITGKLHKELCQLYHAKASIISIQSQPVIAIELIGNRFLRQMVRILVATAIKHAWSLASKPSKRSTNILLSILHEQNRQLAEVALPPYGLCFAGVGYDAEDLSFFRYMSQAQKKALQQSYQRDFSHIKF